MVQGLTQIQNIVQDTQQSRCNNLRVIGGLSISCGTKQGTAAIVIDYDGGIYLLTAGHVVGEPDTEVKCQDIVIGKVYANYYPNPDIAMVKINPGIRYGLNEVKVGNQIYKDVKLADMMPRNNEDVIMAGASGNEYGTVLVGEADVTGEQQEVLRNISIANYYSEESNSGAAVLSQQLDTPLFLGIHGGRVVYNNISRSWFTPIDNIGL